MRSEQVANAGGPRGNKGNEYKFPTMAPSLECPELEAVEQAAVEERTNKGNKWVKLEREQGRGTRLGKKGNVRRVHGPVCRAARDRRQQARQLEAHMMQHPALSSRESARGSSRAFGST